MTLENLINIKQIIRLNISTWTCCCYIFSKQANVLSASLTWWSSACSTILCPSLILHLLPDSHLSFLPALFLHFHCWPLHLTPLVPSLVPATSLHYPSVSVSHLDHLVHYHATYVLGPGDEMEHNVPLCIHFDNWRAKIMGQTGKGTTLN